MIDKIEFLDERFYRIADDVYYPSVTTILDVYPKGPNFTQWLKDVGNQAKIIAERAAESGIKVHNAIEKLVAGHEITWDGKTYSESEWQGILRFLDFYQNFHPNIIACEFIVVSHKYKYAGTADLVCKINNDTWLIDFKFGNAVYPTYFFQIAAYKNAVEEISGKKIDKIGILHLKAETRGRDRSGKIMQGAGWKLIEPDKSYDHLLKIFLSVLGIYNEENPESKPKNRIYPSIIKL
jgi:hypothetical protein